MYRFWQAHVVNEDEDEEMNTAQVQELSEEGQKEAEKRDAATSEESGAPRPDLTHQPEIVESPKAKGAEAATIPPMLQNKDVELTDKSEDPTKTI
jgi:hypothetical protein